MFPSWYQVQVAAMFSRCYALLSAVRIQRDTWRPWAVAALVREGWLSPVSHYIPSFRLWMLLLWTLVWLRRDAVILELGSRELAREAAFPRGCGQLQKNICCCGKMSFFSPLSVPETGNPPAAEPCSWLAAQHLCHLHTREKLGGKHK